MATSKPERFVMKVSGQNTNLKNWLVNRQVILYFMSQPVNGVIGHH